MPTCLHGTVALPGLDPPTPCPTIHCPCRLPRINKPRVRATRCKINLPTTTPKCPLPPHPRRLRAHTAPGAPATAGPPASGGPRRTTTWTVPPMKSRMIGPTTASSGTGAGTISTTLCSPTASSHTTRTTTRRQRSSFRASATEATTANRAVPARRQDDRNP